MNREKHSGLSHLFYALSWSLSGLRAAFRDETAFRQELFFFVILAPLGLWLGETALQIILLIGSLILVLITELVNTAVEAAVDRVGGEKHALSKKAKDVGSAAVLLAIVNAVFVWGVLLYVNVIRVWAH